MGKAITLAITGADVVIKKRAAYTVTAWNAVFKQSLRHTPNLSRALGLSIP